MPSDTPNISADDVIAFLKDNPSFVNDHPDALEALIPPKERGRRGQPADFQSYAIERLKTDKEEILETTKEVLAASRANMNNQQRIHIAVLRLLESNNFADFIQCITMDLANLLDVDIATLVVEAAAGDIPHVHVNGIRVIPEGTVDDWMGEDNLILQDNIAGIEAIYGGGAGLVASQILLRVDIAMDTPPAILAFGSRNPDMFNEGQATDQIVFLARVIERLFRHWLKLPV